MDSKVYFQNVANQWDTIRKDFFSEEVRDRAYEVAGVKVGQLAADIGAGTGFITEGLIKKGLTVIAVDRSEEMIEQMREKFNSFKGIAYLQGESENLPIKNDTVDYSMANMYLHHVEKPLLAIKEMVRILKPGGKLVITDLDEHDFEFLKTEHHDRWMGFRRDDIENWLSSAGLENIMVRSIDGNCCAESTCGCEKASISIFIACGEK
ncbi:class I SAM-dependent methyltransferase [Clostridium sp. YIM B02506]|uniref:class I SAM-dependent methyltransferase n=1 Tax=Clostridium sp. YIM B02506 TaxID=2910680 RepID=UPI001EEDA4EC|nr:class I SAM-dependent methyltransferase [Clostridium sp. YIM B02506]